MELHTLRLKYAVCSRPGILGDTRYLRYEHRIGLFYLFHVFIPCFLAWLSFVIVWVWCVPFLSFSPVIYLKTHCSNDFFLPQILIVVAARLCSTQFLWNFRLNYIMVLCVFFVYARGSNDVVWSDHHYLPYAKHFMFLSAVVRVSVCDSFFSAARP